MDVGAGAEDPVPVGGQDDTPDFRVLEAEALDSVVQLDVHAQIVGIELELVAWLQRMVFLDRHGQPCEASLEGELPVEVPARLGLEREDLGIGRFDVQRLHPR